MSTSTTPATATKAVRSPLSRATKRYIGIGAIVVVLIGMILGTKIVPADDPLAQGTQKFDAASYGGETFPGVQSAIADQATDAETLAAAIAEDPAAAATEYSVQSSGGAVYSTTFTGIVGEGKSGIYEVAVDGIAGDLLIRIQTGPAINGTELRDATGEIEFGQFVNQIDYQNAAAALNEELKTQVLANVDTTNLTGATVEITGAFTLINPSSWLVTPVEMTIQ
ncbi:DUF2291 family protein [Rhodoglobus aureus]|uniref:DUF2291 domain-containing protein n=1 Tax=Rhodoglobus aureus TaxID=191497 RepID=A0ABP4G0W6_9MICO